MLEKIEKLISRSQRGIKVKEGDMFLRSGRLFIVVGSESSGVAVMEPSTGKERSFSLSGFKSRHIQRVKVSSAAKPSAVDTAKEVASSVSLGKAAKSAILTSLQRSSGEEDSLKIRDIANGVWSMTSGGGSN